MAQRREEAELESHVQQTTEESSTDAVDLAAHALESLPGVYYLPEFITQNEEAQLGEIRSR